MAESSSPVSPDPWKEIDRFLTSNGEWGMAKKVDVARAADALRHQQERDALKRWYAEHPSYYTQMCEFLKVDATKSKELWQCITGLQERVKFTETFESLQLKLFTAEATIQQHNTLIDTLDKRIADGGVAQEALAAKLVAAEATIAELEAEIARLEARLEQAHVEPGEAHE